MSLIGIIYEHISFSCCCELRKGMDMMSMSMGMNMERQMERQMELHKVMLDKVLMLELQRRVEPGRQQQLDLDPLPRMELEQLVWQSHG